MTEEALISILMGTPIITEDCTIKRIDIQKHPCPYCHGITYDDSRGHCCGCGAPREQEKPPRGLTLMKGVESATLKDAMLSAWWEVAK